MTSHELARALLNGPDLPVEVRVANAKDTAYSQDLAVNADASLEQVSITGWVFSDDEGAYAPWAPDVDDED
jgi:hypothetical protein